MAGSPRKRAKREAAERQQNMAAGIAEMSAPSQGSEPESPTPNLPAPAVTPLQGEVLPPEGAPEPTRTALKRAMRAKAQEHADTAIAVLVANMNDPNIKASERADAANKLLEWGYGKPGVDLSDGEGGLLVLIKRFGEDQT